MIVTYKHVKKKIPFSQFTSPHCSRTKKTKVDASEVMYNGRLSWHGNSGGKELVTSSSSSTTTVVNGKVCSLINKYLSPSVESELLEELQTPKDSNGRRGSLPAELILCWKKEYSSFFLDYFLSTTLLLRIYQSSWDIFGGYIPNWKAWSVIFKFKRYCIYTVDIPP